MCVLAHLPEKWINHPKSTPSSAGNIQTSHLLSTPDSSTAPSRGWDHFNICISIPFQERVSSLETAEALLKGPSAGPAVGWRFLSTAATLGGFAAGRVLVFCLRTSQMTKMWQQCLLSAGETSHGHFYYSVLQDLIFILERADKFPANRIAHLAVKSALNTQEIQYLPWMLQPKHRTCKDVNHPGWGSQLFSSCKLIYVIILNANRIIPALFLPEEIQDNKIMQGGFISYKLPLCCLLC